MREDRREWRGRERIDEREKIVEKKIEIIF